MERIADVLEAHQRRRSELDSLGEALPAYRLQPAERRATRSAVGFPDDALVQGL